MGKFKQWIASHKLASIIVASVLTVGVALSVALSLALSHKHTYSEDWAFDETGHYHECVCGDRKDVTEHDLSIYDRGHNYHMFQCSVCDWVSEEQDHVYESDTATRCLYCDHERETTTLAFKAGGTSENFIYNGEVQTFNKENLVSTNVVMDNVIVEYSLMGVDERIWTTQPKDAGDYYIRLRVEADDNFTSLSIDTLGDSGRYLRIQAKTLSLENFVLAYDASALNTSYRKKVIDLASADIEGLCGSDTLQVTLYKNPGANVFSAGEVWTIEDLFVTSHAEKYVGLQTVGNNYKFDGTSTGKLYIANSTTSTGSSVQEKYEADSVHIDQNGIAYYCAVLNRTRRNGETSGEPFATDYYFTNTNDVAIKVKDVFTRSSNASVKITGNGHLVVYGTAVNPIVIICVENKGTDSAGIDNYFRLIEDISIRTVDDAETWGNALTFAEGGYKVVLKKNSVIIEESKYVPSTTGNSKYYKMDASGKTYYSVMSGENYRYYIYEQNESAWIRRSLTDDYDEDEAKANALSLIKLNEEWLKNITSAEAFANFALSYEDLTYHTNVEYTLNGVVTTHIALRFAGGKLVYAEFTDGEDKYTIEVTNLSGGVYGVFVSLPDYMGSSKANAFEVLYSDDKFTLENVDLFAGDNWFVVDITSDLFNENKVPTTNKCEIDGTFTTSSDATLTVVGESASETSITNNKSDQNGKLNFSGLSETGKYYIKITSDKDCTGSLNIEFKGTFAM